MARQIKVVNPSTPPGDGSTPGGDLGPSSEFMREDLARSGLEPKDLNVQPRPIFDGVGIPAYDIIYPQPGMYRTRYESGAPKYKGPAGRTEIYFRLEHWPIMQRQKTPLIIAEGEKKLECWVKYTGVPGMAVGGAYGFRASDTETLGLLPDLEFMIKRLAHVGVILILDGDIVGNRDIASAARWFAACCAKLGAKCRVIQLPEASDGGERVGLDDWIVSTGLKGARLVEALMRLPTIDVAELPEPKRVAIERLKLDAEKREDGSWVVKPTVDNAVALVKDVIGHRIATDQFLGEVIDNRPYKDVDDGKTRQRAERLIGAPFKPELIVTARRILMEDTQTNVVADWLRALRWDGRKRVGTVFRDLFGAKKQDKNYLHDAGVAFFCGAVKRAVAPGSHVEQMLILQGRQGIGKTRALDAVAGEFAGRKLLATMRLGSEENELFRVIEESWIVSFDELAGHSKRDDEYLKNLLSQDEHIRNAKYLEKPKRHLRHCVFAATTNAETPLRDPTGNRRYLVVQCDTIDVDGIAAARDQLFAEAFALVEQGVEFWRIRGAEVEQEKARNRHPWEEAIATYLSTAELPEVVRVVDGGPPTRHRFTSAFAVAAAVRASHSGDTAPVERSAMIAGRITSMLGWERAQVRRGAIEWGQIDPAGVFPSVPDGRGGNHVPVPERAWVLLSPAVTTSRSGAVPSKKTK